MLGQTVVCENVQGKSLILDALQREEMGEMARMANDHTVSRWTSSGYGYSLEQEIAWYEDACTKADRCKWAIRYDGKLIGNCGWHAIHPQARNAGFGVMIGDKDQWNKGINTAILRAATEYGFQTLNLETLYYDSIVDNVASRKTAERVGYKHYGTMPNRCYVDGAWHDLWCSALTRQEWHQLKDGKSESLYSQTADIYDAIYTEAKDYPAEAMRVVQFVADRSSTGTELLDVACGTGLHAKTLAQHFTVEGLDLTPGLLDIARKRNPELVFHEGDMRTFELGKQYDVVTCLFSAVGHLTNEAELNQAIGQMASHLRPGGMLIVEPWIFPEKFTEGKLTANFIDGSDVKISRLATGKRQGNYSILEMHHTVARKTGIEYFVETTRLALFTKEQYEQAFHLAGLVPTHDEQGLMGRGLFIGTKD